MKLKEAVRLCKLRNINKAAKLKYVAADKCGILWGYVFEPKKREDMWTTNSHYEHLGMYTGKKCWNNTLRQVGVKLDG